MPTIHTNLTERVHRALRTEIARQDTNWAELLTQLADLTTLLHDHGDDVHVYRSLDTDDDAPLAAIRAVPAVPGIAWLTVTIADVRQEVGREMAAYLAVEAIKADRCEDYDTSYAEEQYRACGGGGLDFDDYCFEHGMDDTPLDFIVAHVARWYYKDRTAVPGSLSDHIRAAVPDTRERQAFMAAAMMRDNPFDRGALPV